MNEFEQGQPPQDLIEVQPENESVKERRDLIFQMYADKYTRKQTADLLHIEVDGERIDQKLSASSGMIVEREVEDGKIGIVETDTGAILDNAGELLTNRVSGCMVAFGKGKSHDGEDRVVMIHLTPNSRLGWGNYRQQGYDERWGEDTRETAAEKIHDALQKASVDLESIEITLLRTAGAKTAHYYYGFSEDNIAKRVSEFKQALEKKGVSVFADHSIPMAEMSVYWNPDAPEDLYIVGERKIPDGDGVRRAEGEERGIAEQVIKLN